MAQLESSMQSQLQEKPRIVQPSTQALPRIVREAGDLSTRSVALSLSVHERQEIRCVRREISDLAELSVEGRIIFVRVTAKRLMIH